MMNVFHPSALWRTSREFKKKAMTRFVSAFNFDSDEEILTNAVDKVQMIGLNLPDTKNVLTETALQSLKDCIKHFDEDDNFSCAVLHGIGGNFCTGIERTKEALKQSQDILKVLHSLKKPIIAALNGYTTNYGLHLAVMCDIRIMEALGVVGLNEQAGKIEIQPFVRERLIWIVGPARAMELLGTKQSWPDHDVLASKFITRLVEQGCALGQSLIYANSLSFNSSLEDLIKEKSEILSFLNARK